MPPSITFYEQPQFRGTGTRYKFPSGQGMLLEVPDVGAHRRGTFSSARIDGLSRDKLAAVEIEAYSLPNFRGERYLWWSIDDGRIPFFPKTADGRIASFRVVLPRVRQANDPPEEPSRSQMLLPPELPQPKSGPPAWELTLYNNGLSAWTAKTPGESADERGPHPNVSIIGPGAWERATGGARPRDLGLPKRLLAWHEDTEEVRPATEEYESLMAAAANPDDPELQDFAIRVLRSIGITPPRVRVERRGRGGLLDNINLDVDLYFGRHEPGFVVPQVPPSQVPPGYVPPPAPGYVPPPPPGYVPPPAPAVPHDGGSGGRRGSAHTPPPEHVPKLWGHWTAGSAYRTGYAHGATGFKALVMPEVALQAWYDEGYSDGKGGRPPRTDLE